MGAKYLNQLRAIAPGQSSEPWTDVCLGHDTMYEAIACKDRAAGLFDGTIKPKSLIDDVTAAEAKLGTAQGIRYEFRTIKRITTDEVVEEEQVHADRQS